MDIKRFPHQDLIRENETVRFRSIFDFKGGAMELFPFLYGCEEKNCTVFFENEGIEIRPDSSAYDNVRLSIYLMIAEYPKIAEDYVRYMMKYVREADRKPVVREDK